MGNDVTEHTAPSVSVEANDDNEEDDARIITSYDPFNLRPFYEERVEQFDPFELAPFFGWARKRGTWWLFLLLPICTIIVALGALLAGRFGTFDDFRMAWYDVQASVGVETEVVSPANFTFMRDATTWFLLIVIVLTCMLVHRQWKLMKSALPDLAAYGALKPPLEEPSDSRWPMFRLSAILKDRSKEEYLDALIERVNRLLNKNVAIVLAVIAAMIALAPVVGSATLGIYGAFEPGNMAETDGGSWANDAYQSWWAGGLGGEGLRWLFGMFSYWAVASFGIYVILLQNFVGLLAVYIVICIPKVALLDADWLDRDGQSGWSPIGRIYRTVYLSLALHGSALTVLLIAFGLDHGWLLSALIVIWAAVLPVYIAIPFAVFRRVSQRIRERRVNDLASLMKQSNIEISGNSVRLAPCILEIERANGARIQPLRMQRRYELPAMLGVIVLPIVLAIAQTVFQVQLAAGG